MTFLAPVAAEIGGWTLKKILPWALLGVVIVALGAALWVQTARLEAMRTALASTQHDRDLATADAKRWAGAAGRMQQVIDDQAAELTRQKADRAQAQQQADATAQAQARNVARLNTELDQLKAKAHAHPDQVRPLGPLVLDALRHDARLHDAPGGLRQPAASNAAAPAAGD